MNLIYTVQRLRGEFGGHLGKCHKYTRITQVNCKFAVRTMPRRGLEPPCLTAARSKRAVYTFSPSGHSIGMVGFEPTLNGF